MDTCPSQVSCSPCSQITEGSAKTEQCKDGVWQWPSCAADLWESITWLVTGRMCLDISLAPDRAVLRTVLKPLAGTGGPLLAMGPNSLFRRSSGVIPAGCLIWPPASWNGEGGSSMELSGPLLGLLRMLQSTKTNSSALLNAMAAC